LHGSLIICSFSYEDCAGEIDGTYFIASAQKRVSCIYGRKHDKIKKELVVEFDMRFTYVLARWEGSAHDATIRTDILERPYVLKILEGAFYLADVRFACRPGIFPPFRSTRYHLNEFSSKHYPKNAKEISNLENSSVRVMIERTFTALKNKFKILDQNPFHHSPSKLS
jgi:hypothetical protein